MLSLAFNRASATKGFVDRTILYINMNKFLHILNYLERFSLFILLISFLNVVDVYAHALWIQTNPIEEKGQQQTVTIIYAEPGQTPEKISD